MAEKAQEVKKDQTASAGNDGVKESVAPADTDMEVEYAALQAELERMTSDRDNYRTGLLKAKGKIPADDTDSNDLDAIVERKVAEKLAETQAAQAEQKSREFTANLLKKNKELALALKNRSQVTSAASSGKSEAPTGVKDTYFSDEQIAALKKRGLDPVKVKENMERNRQRVQ